MLESPLAPTPQPGACPRWLPPSDPLAPDETLFFVHIPKCAGSSFRAVLKRWFGKGLLTSDTNDRELFRQRVAARADPPRAVAGHFAFGLHEGVASRPFYVSLVRDPVDRFVSVYKHARQTPGHVLNPAAAALDLEAFYEHTLVDPRARRRTVGVQCFFLARTPSFSAAWPIIARNYRLLAPAEAFDDFIREAADLFDKPAIPSPTRNRRPSEDRVALAARALEPRIRRDHHEDQQLYDRLRAAAES